MLTGSGRSTLLMSTRKRPRPNLATTTRKLIEKRTEPIIHIAPNQRHP